MKHNWTYKKLGEMVNIHDTLRKPVTKKDRKAGVYPYYGATGIQDYVDNYIFDGRYVLVGEDGAKWGANEQSAYIIEGKSWVNNHAHVLSFTSNVCDSFVAYYLNYKDLDSFISGAIVRKLTQKSLISIPIPIPSLSEQESIVAELDAINHLIDLQEKQLCEYDRLAQSLFYSTFGDPTTNPKGWEIKKLGEVFEISSGGTPSKKISSYWDNGNVPWIGSNMCQNCVIYETDGKYITQEGLKHSSAKLLPTNTVLVALVGATIGKVALLNTESSTNQNIAFIKPHKDFAAYFVYFHLMNQYDEFMNIGNGDFKMATQGFIKELRIMCPPLSLQQSFAAQIEAIEQQKALIRRSLDETRTLLAARMQYYFE